MKFKKVFKKILSTVCAIPLILSTVSNCNADKLKVIFLGQSKSGKANIVNVIKDKNAEIINKDYKGKNRAELFVHRKIVGWILPGNNDVYSSLNEFYLKDSGLAVICVEVDDIGNIDERCQKYADFIDKEESIKEIILVITKVDNEEKKEIISENMETSIKEKFKKMKKIFVTSAEKSSPYRKEIEELKKYIIEKVSVSEEEESEGSEEESADNIEKRAHHMPSVTSAQIENKIKDEKETILLSDKLEDKKSLFDRVDKKKALGAACLVVTVSGICYCIKDKFRKFFVSDNL
ncbi:MAG: ADP-ribosylation factor-like protein, partial [Firmicutes bacterium]|nr:ADP-ribosylation factor-like protein [Bacillota bacterium]